MSNGINYAWAREIGQQAYQTAQRYLASDTADFCRAQFDDTLGMPGTWNALPRTPVVASEASLEALTSTPAVAKDFGRG